MLWIKLNHVSKRIAWDVVRLQRLSIAQLYSRCRSRPRGIEGLGLRVNSDVEQL